MYWNLFSLLLIVTTVITSNGMRIITRNDEEFSQYRLEGFFASHYGSTTQSDALFNPKKIFIPETEQDVMDIVKTAQKDDTQIVVKSGGHSYIGASMCNDCYQIDMKYLNKTEFIRDSTDKITSINVGVGQTLGTLYAILAVQNVSIIGGNCPTVGVGGHFQSSSIGGASRALGAGLDYIKRIKLIDSKGKMQTVSKLSVNKNDRDLFWAILGSSPGSWGIILEYEFEPIYDEDYPFVYMYSFAYYYNKAAFKYGLDEFVRVLNSDLLKDIQDIGSIYLFIEPLIKGEYFIDILVSWIGVDHGSIFNQIPDTNTTYYAEILSGFDLIPGELVLNMSINETISLSSGMLYGARPPANKTRYYIQHSSFDKSMMDELISTQSNLNLWINNVSGFVDSVLSENDVSANIQFWNFQIPDKNPIINDIEIDAMNAMNNAVSYPYRNVIFSADNWIKFENESVLNKVLQITNGLRNVIDSEFTAISDIEEMAFPNDGYTNTTLDLTLDWKKYFNANDEMYQRLREIKTKIDPNNMFNGPLTIKPFAQGKANASHMVLYAVIAVSVVLILCISIYCIYWVSKGKKENYTDLSQIDDDSQGSNDI